MPRVHVKRPHRHHQSSLMPVVAGGLLVSTAMLAASGPRRRRRRTVYVYSPEQEAQIADQRAREAAAHRLSLEQQKASLRKKQLEIEILENKKEQTRCNNYTKHLELAKVIDTLPYDELSDAVNSLPKLEEPIQRFNDSPYQGIPETKHRNNNLILGILNHARLYINSKKTLFDQLVYKQGYINYYKVLLQQPILNKLIATPELSDTLNNLYINYYLKHNDNYLLLETERNIWAVFYRQNEVNILKQIYNLSTPDKKKQLLFDWLKSKNTPDEIIDTYNLLENNFTLTRSDLMIFYKIAKQKILRIEISYNEAEPGMGTEGVSFNNNRRIEDFLGTHRGYFSSCYSMLFNPKSFQIHKLIETNQLADAKNLLAEEDKKERTFCEDNRLKFN